MRLTLRRSVGKSYRRAAATSVALVAALALSACGASGSGDNELNADEPGPGVSDTELRVGFIVINQATAGGSGGFTVPDQGDSEAQVRALVDAVNADGGVAGRQVVPVIKTFESSTASAQTEAALCTAFTDDDEVFAVVLNGQRDPATRACYKNANTVMLEVTGNAQGEQVYADNEPFYWTPTAPTFDTHFATLVPSLDEQGFFEGDVKVGVIQEKGPQFSALVNDTLLPALEAVGISDVQVEEIDQATPDSAASTSRNVVQNLKSAGVDRVIFAGRADNAGYITGTALPQNYFPRLAISTFEDPQFSALNPAFFPPQSLEGAMGLGLTPTKDRVLDLEWPHSDAEAACLDIYTEAGIEFEDRGNTGDAMRYCDSVMFLKAALDNVEGDAPLNAQTFQQAAFGLGDSWQAATNFSTEFGDGVYAPTSGYRELAYVDGEFTYTSDVKPLVRD